MINLVLALAVEGLKLVNEKERTKLSDELLELQLKYAEEIEKDSPDHAVLDVLEQKIFLVGRSIVNRIKNG